MSADSELHDATSAVRWLLAADGTDSRLAVDTRLMSRCAALNALVSTRVWTPRIPDVMQYRNLGAAVWFAEVSGDGPDEHGEDTDRSFEFTALGGTSTGTAAGAYTPKTAEEVARAVSAVLSVANNVQTPYGVILACLPEMGMVYGFEDDIGWPWWKQVWAITTGATG